MSRLPDTERFDKAFRQADQVEDDEIRNAMHKAIQVLMTEQVRHCELCFRYIGGRCQVYDRTVPEEFKPEGCENFTYDRIPF